MLGDVYIIEQTFLPKLLAERVMALDKYSMYTVQRTSQSETLKNKFKFFNLI